MRTRTTPWIRVEKYGMLCALGWYYRMPQKAMVGMVQSRILCRVKLEGLFFS